MRIIFEKFDEDRFIEIILRESEARALFRRKIVSNKEFIDEMLYHVGVRIASSRELEMEDTEDAVDQE